MWFIWPQLECLQPLCWGIPCGVMSIWSGRESLGIAWYIVKRFHGYMNNVCTKTVTMATQITWSVNSIQTLSTFTPMYKKLQCKLLEFYYLYHLRLEQDFAALTALTYLNPKVPTTTTTKCKIYIRACQYKVYHWCETTSTLHTALIWPIPLAG